MTDWNKGHIIAKEIEQLWEEYMLLTVHIKRTNKKEKHSQLNKTIKRDAKAETLREKYEQLCEILEKEYGEVRGLDLLKDEFHRKEKIRVQPYHHPDRFIGGKIMRERTTIEMFEIYKKYALEYGAGEFDEDMWTDDDEAEDFRVQSTEPFKDLVESLNAENLTTEEKIYIALKVGMLM